MQYQVDSDGMAFLVANIRRTTDHESAAAILRGRTAPNLFDVNVLAVAPRAHPDEVTARSRRRHPGSMSAKSAGRKRRVVIPQGDARGTPRNRALRYTRIAPAER